MDKRKVGVLFCGGCNCFFDRKEVYDEIKAAFEERCDFFIYRGDEDTSSDAIVLINGCQSECLMADDYPGDLLLINNLNYKGAVRLFSDMMKGKGEW